MRHKGTRVLYMLIGLAVIVFGIIWLAGCAGTPPPSEVGGGISASMPSVVEGTVTYRERIALAPGAVLEVILEDVSLKDAAAEEIARTEIRPDTGPPFEYTIDLDPADIDGRHTYSVRARITVEGGLVFTSDTVYPVLTGGAGNRADIMLIKAGKSTRKASGDLMAGEFVYVADAAALTECSSGRRYPVAMEKDYIHMERAYLAEPKEMGEGLYVTFDGEVTDIHAMEGDGTVKGIVVKRFIRAWPGEYCGRAGTDAPTVNTYWRIVRLGGEEIASEDGRREPHLILKEEGERVSYSATVGCNILSGGCSLEGDRITFQQSISTLMACPPPLDELERRLGGALTGIRGFRIKGNTMELCDETGVPVALLQAVYFLTD